MENAQHVVLFFAFYAFAYVVLFLIVPLVAALLIHRGFQRIQILDVPFKKCLHDCYSASSLAIVAEFITAFVVIGSDATDKRVVFVTVYIATLLAAIPLLLRQRSARAVLVTVGGTLLAIAFGYGLVVLVAMVKLPG